MKKLINLVLVVAMICTLCVAVSAAEMVEHPVPPSELCNCDNPSAEYEDQYGGLMDCDDTYHIIRWYNVYLCTSCGGYEYDYMYDVTEKHVDIDVNGVCDEELCRYELN